jgi:hypothetical protein
MAKVPDRLDPVPALRLQERVDVGEIIFAAAVDERPGDAFAGDGDAERAEEAVILVGMDAVLRLLAKVAAALVLPEERRAFEARQEESGEDRAGCHASITHALRDRARS